MLSTKTIDAALKNRPTSGQLVMRDKEVPGLTLVIGKIKATWTVEAMARGKRRKIVIGDTTSHALDEARTAARKLKSSLHSESPDQAAERIKRAESAGVVNSLRLQEYVDWLKSDGLKPKSIIDAESQTRLALQSIQMMDRPPGDITEQHLRDVIAKASKGTRRSRYGYLSRYLKWCGSRGFTQHRFREIDIEDLEKPRQPTQRDRVLTLSELERILMALQGSNAIAPVFADLIRFLILVPARKNEAAKAKTRDVNVDGKYFEIAGSKSKNGQRHRFPLPPSALALIKRRMGGPNDLLFPAPRSGGVISGWAKLKKAIDDALPEDFDKWVIHDFRRAFASAMADTKVDETVVDLILNHKAAATRGGVTGVYVTAARWDERVAALELWDAKISSLKVEV